ncbi:MAG: hypothetical protein BWY66_01525 [bacterium ADurb.Bin374]|nr:MAG: hypothetical protein BWY66_01525 [bacterium ADurb.Bin374]
MPLATHARSSELTVAKHSAKTIFIGIDGLRPWSASFAQSQVNKPAKRMTVSELGTNAKNEASSGMPNNVLSTTRSTRRGSEVYICLNTDWKQIAARMMIRIAKIELRSPVSLHERARPKMPTTMAILR